MNAMTHYIIGGLIGLVIGVFVGWKAAIAGVVGGFRKGYYKPGDNSPL